MIISVLQGDWMFRHRCKTRIEHSEILRCSSGKPWSCSNESKGKRLAYHNDNRHEKNMKLIWNTCKELLDSCLVVDVSWRWRRQQQSIFSGSLNQICCKYVQRYGRNRNSNSVNKYHHLMLLLAVVSVDWEESVCTWVELVADSNRCLLSNPDVRHQSADEFSTCEAWTPLQMSLYALCVSWARPKPTVCPPVRSKFVI